MAEAFSFSSLNGGQRDAVSTLEGPVLILAGAGTGKTRTVTCRIAHMLEQGIPAQRILAVTFTNKAAAEMGERVKEMCGRSASEDITVCTFHSLCVRILREGIEKLGYKKNFSIYTGSDQVGLIKQLIVRNGGAEEKLEPKMVLSLISNAKNAGSSIDTEDDLVHIVARAYNNELRAQNAVDFDDLLILAEKLLREYEDVRELMRRRYQYVTVDEFQDTNSLQMQLLQQLVGAPYHVCVVGDDDQSIYGFRGADPTNILQFESFFPNPKVIRLEMNYRSSEAVLHTANSLIKKNVGRREKELRPTKLGGLPVRLVSMPGDEEEGLFVAEEIHDRQSREGRPWEDFAILFRTNMQSRMLEEGLRTLKIPYRMVGAQSFYDRREVKDLISYLEVFSNSEADVPLLRIMNSPPRGIGQGSTVLITDASREAHCSVWESMGMESVQSQLSTKVKNSVNSFVEIMMKFRDRMTSGEECMGEVFKGFIGEIGYLEWMNRGCKTEAEREQRASSVHDVIDALRDASGKRKSLKKFLDQSALASDKDDDDIEKQKGVCLITMHASKGLEFPIVYLVGMEDGILPHKRSIEEGTVDEERRILYVGITRAQEQLVISFCQYRKKYGEMVFCQNSMFLKEIDYKFVVEEDYDDIMGAEASEEETEGFFSDLRSLLDG